MDEKTYRRWLKIRSKIVYNRRLFGKQGILASRIVNGKVVYSLRYNGKTTDGRRIKHNLYLGSNPALVHRVRNEIWSLREEMAERRNLTKLVPAAMKLLKSQRIPRQGPQIGSTTPRKESA